MHLPRQRVQLCQLGHCHDLVLCQPQQMLCKGSFQRPPARTICRTAKRALEYILRNSKYPTLEVSYEAGHLRTQSQLPPCRSQLPSRAHCTASFRLTGALRHQRGSRCRCWAGGWCTQPADKSVVSLHIWRGLPVMSQASVFVKDMLCGCNRTAWMILRCWLCGVSNSPVMVEGKVRHEHLITLTFGLA